MHVQLSTSRDGLIVDYNHYTSMSNKEDQNLIVNLICNRSKIRVV